VSGADRVRRLAVCRRLVARAHTAGALRDRARPERRGRRFVPRTLDPGAGRPQAGAARVGAAARAGPPAAGRPGPGRGGAGDGPGGVLRAGCAGIDSYALIRNATCHRRPCRPRTGGRHGRATDAVSNTYTTT